MRVHHATAVDVVDGLGYLSAPFQALVETCGWVVIEVRLEIAMTRFA